MQTTVINLEDIAMIPDPNTEEFLIPGHLIQCNTRSDVELYRIILQMAMRNFLLPEDRTLIRLRYWDQLSKTEIGKQLGVTPSAVCKRLTKAENRLREHIGFCFEVYTVLKEGGYRQNAEKGGQRETAHATGIAIGG